MPRLVAMICIALIILMQGCIPVVYKQTPEILPSSPIVLADRETNNPIDTALLIPRYNQRQLSNPLQYTRGIGQNFHQSKGLAAGLWVPLVGDGMNGIATGQNLDGLVVIAPGYYVSLVDIHHLKEDPTVIKLLPLPVEKRKAQIPLLLKLLEADYVSPQFLEIYELSDYPIKGQYEKITGWPIFQCKFTKKDRAMILDTIRGWAPPQ